MSSTAPFNQRLFPSLDFAESVDSWSMWPLIGSFVFHVAVYSALMYLPFLPEVESMTTSYHVSLLDLPAKPASPTRAGALPTTNAHPQDPAELLMPTIQSVRIPEITKPQPANRASGSVPQVPDRVSSGAEISVRDLTLPIVPPEPPQLATVRIKEEPMPLPPFPVGTSKSKRDSREPAIANLAIPELVSVLTVLRQGSTPTASETQDGPTAPHGAESASMETSYWGQIRDRIHQRWFVAGMHHLDLLQVVLAFRVERTGRINGLVVHRSSGNNEYDLRAKRAVVAASPFPPFPPTVTEDHLDVNFKFSFQFVQ